MADGLKSTGKGKGWYGLVPAAPYASWRARRAMSKAGHRGERELRLLPLLVPRDRVAVDVGANRGVYSYYLSKLAPRVIAYEPNPAMAEFLERAKFPKVEVRCKAVSDREGTAEFAVPVNDKGQPQFNTGRIGVVKCDAERFEVPTVRLDDEDLGDVGFLKVDVEGLEPEVVRGAKELLQRCRPVVMLEDLDVYHRGGSEMVRTMEELGYCTFFYDGESLVPLARAKVDLAGRNFIYFPTDRSGGEAAELVK